MAKKALLTDSHRRFIRGGLAIVAARSRLPFLEATVSNLVQTARLEIDA